MAERMSTMRTLVLLLTPVLNAVAAEPLRDPTRPPAAAVTTPGAPARDATAPMGKLTAIRIDERQRVATIGGVHVKVGDSLPEGTVRVIRNTEVVLATPAGARVLKLYPGVRRLAHGKRARTATRIARHGTAGSSRHTGAEAPPAPIQGEPTQ